RVAISVDMLDTGVDIPEVCNLAFVKPVFSKIKFWQMIGRGTRANATCTHKDWLPNGNKDDFLIFDFWKVFDWFDMHPEGRDERPEEAVPAKIFLLRLRELEHFQIARDETKVEAVKQKIMRDMAELPKNSITIRDAVRELTPLMRYKRTEPRPTIILDIDDVIQEGGYIEFGPVTDPKSMLAKAYMEKVEKRIKELAQKNPTVQKIMRDEILDEKDLEDLERTLNSPELYVTEEALQKLYKQYRGTLVQFIKKLLGLYEFPDPEKKIDEAFKTFMIEKNYLSADQINFLRTIE